MHDEVEAQMAQYLAQVTELKSRELDSQNRISQLIDENTGLKVHIDVLEQQVEAQGKKKKKKGK